LAVALGFWLHLTGFSLPSQRELSLKMTFWLAQIFSASAVSCWNYIGMMQLWGLLVDAALVGAVKILPRLATVFLAFSRFGVGPAGGGPGSFIALT
jgi:hypothetical protein